MRDNQNPALATALSALERLSSTSWPAVAERLAMEEPDSQARLRFDALCDDGASCARNLSALIKAMLNDEESDDYDSHFDGMLSQYRDSVVEGEDALRSALTGGLMSDAAIEIASLYASQLAILRQLPEHARTMEHPISTRIDLPPRQEVILLLHGIRTEAPWAGRVASQLTGPTTKVVPVKYGYLDLVRFLVPFFRHGPIHRVEREIAAIQETENETDISVIAHSFGTFAITEILENRPDLKLKRLVLCGSIVRQGFPWHHVHKQVTFEIVNECGRRDIWPILGSSFTTGFGPSGVFGFGTFRVRDRFHDFSHSDFFNISFVKDYWVSLFKNNILTEGLLDWERATPPLWQSLLARTPVWLLALIVILIGASSRPIWHR